MRDEILGKLAEIEDMLAEATCDGEQLAKLDCFADVIDKVGALAMAVEYYVD